jgi:UDP-N-acetylmuramoyl-L-alanyl-D-glutamate--2,6-diaminopimelate ligase
MHTTPDSITINHYLSEMVKEVEYCFMEELSRNSPKKNGRTTVCWWRFTNLSHDHLTIIIHFAEYRDVKKSFFDNLPKRLSLYLYR